MTLSQLAGLIETAIFGRPPKKITDMCGEYYQPYYHLFYWLTRSMSTWQANNCCVVELGVNRGYGIYSFALGNPKMRVIGLDLNIEPEHTLLNVEFHLMSALPAPDFIDNIAILHIDTEHSYGNAANEFMQYKHKLLPGAVVCFDDLHAMDNGVLKAFYELPYPKIQDDRLHPINGYGVLIYDE